MHSNSIRSSKIWQSEEDFIKDLALLNGFEIPDDVKPLRPVHFIRKGKNIKEKPKFEEQLFDSRTGEVIDLKEAELNINDYFYKSKGRGNVLGTFSTESFQLQQQLRLARPMGSGDEAMETFCKRNRQTDKFSVTSDIESYAENKQPTSKIFNTSSFLDKFQPRIKAIRKSSLQSNVLLNSILSKAKEKPEAEVNKIQGIFIDAEGGNYSTGNNNNNNNNNDDGGDFDYFKADCRSCNENHKVIANPERKLSPVETVLNDECFKINYHCKEN